MKKFKKMLRLLGLVFLIVLASIGVGIGGGMPVPKNNKREDTTEITVEAEETSKEDTLALYQVKKQ